LTCDICGSQTNTFLNHYEEHIDPPRKINICRSCHIVVHTSIGRTRSGKYHPQIRKINSLKQLGIPTHYTISPPSQWIKQYCPNLELYVITVGNIIIGVPSDREDLLRNIVSLLPQLIDITGISGLEIQTRKISTYMQTYESVGGKIIKYPKYVLHLSKEFVEIHKLGHLFLVTDQIWFGLPDKESLTEIMELFKNSDLFINAAPGE